MKQSANVHMLMQVIIYYIIFYLPMPNTSHFTDNIVIQVTNYDLMTKARDGNPEQKDKPAIVYRGIPATTKEHVFSFTITPAQAEFVKIHRKEINFSETFRKYLDSIVVEYNSNQKR